jgi:uncharacterized membrane-anchored protein YitT (DUF2179 family)
MSVGSNEGIFAGMAMGRYHARKMSKKQDLENREPVRTSYRTAKKAYQTRVTFRKTLRDAFLLLLGLLSAGFGLKGFLLPTGLVDGGATGISLLLNRTTGFPLPLLLVIVNLPFIMLAYFQIGADFVVKTTLAIIGLAIAVAFVPYPEITTDKLLVAVFGGFFLGMGIGLAVRGGGVLDGTEVLAIYASKRTSLTIGDVILIINIIIFSAAAYLLGLETALYSTLTYLSASKTVDFVIEGIEEYTGVTIISPKSEDIARMITEKIGRGITMYKGTRGFGKRGLQTSEMEILFTVVTRLEVSRLQSEIDAIDPHAFVVMNSIKDTRGGMIKKRPLKS